MISRIGQNLLAVVNDEAQVLEIMTQDGLLGRFYQEALGFRPCYHHISRLVEQIAHRHPNLEVLEIGKSDQRKIFNGSSCPWTYFPRLFADFLQALVPETVPKQSCLLWEKPSTGTVSPTSPQGSSRSPALNSPPSTTGCRTRSSISAGILRPRALRLIHST
jgi:hypothetical protein